MKSGLRSTKLLPLLAGLSMLELGCAVTEATDGGTDGGTTADSGSCPMALPSSAVVCTGAQCSATRGTKDFGEATLSSDTSKSWVVATWATSEVLSDNLSLEYKKRVVGALSPSEGSRRSASVEERATARAAELRAALSPEIYEAIFGEARSERLREEQAIRAQQAQGPIDLAGASGTAIVGFADDNFPEGTVFQDMACSVTAPMCGATSLCVIPEGGTAGRCSSALMIKFRTTADNFDTVASTVRKVGRYGAIVVDDSVSAMVSASDVDELIKRFDEHIAPLDHQFFGEPKDMMGRDRDGNGVVIIFLTPRVAAAGANIVGYFASDDLLPSAMKRYSNAADILYMRPPGAQIPLDAISGTIGHEYQHMINFYAKTILRASQREDVWLDEGLATFAEDMLGYGSDSFTNIAAYLKTVDQTSLTGAGISCPGATTPDNACRRGMAHLLVRYLFEQKGGAAWLDDPSKVTDQGGVAAVKKLVQSGDTGTLLFTQAATDKSFSAWVADLLTLVAVDGAKYPYVSCNARYKLKGPETDRYTHYQRGISLRTGFRNARGMDIPLSGPNTATLESEMTILPANGGEIRTLMVPSGSVKVQVLGPADYDIGFRAIPTMAAPR